MRNERSSDSPSGVLQAHTARENVSAGARWGETGLLTGLGLCRMGVRGGTQLEATLSWMLPGSRGNVVTEYLDDRHVEGELNGV